MDPRRALLPIAPVAVAGLLALGSGLLEDEAPTEPTRRTASATPPRDAETPAPSAPADATPTPTTRGAPIDAPRCIARMTVRELGRQLMRVRQVQDIATLYREQASPEVARAFHTGLAEAAAALAPSVGRSRLLTVAADGLAQLEQPQAAVAALTQAEQIPPPRPSDFDFERSSWRGDAASVAARLGDHARAQALIADDLDAAMTLARTYAELGASDRARALLDAEPPEHRDLGWTMDRARALAGVGALDEAISLADAHGDAAVIRVAMVRTLLARERHAEAIDVLRGADAKIPSEPPPPDAEPRARIDHARDLSLRVAVARALDEAGATAEASAVRSRVQTQLAAMGDHIQTIPAWASLVDDLHRAGQREQAWATVPSLAAIGLADVSAEPMVRVMMLSREGKLDEAIDLIHHTAGIGYPTAYAHVHVALPPDQPELARRLEDGLRLFCEDG